MPVIQVVPITAWSAKKAKIATNIEINSTRSNGLSKKSVADCLQTRPIDHRHRLVRIRGKLTHSKLNEIDRLGDRDFFGSFGDELLDLIDVERDLPGLGHESRGLVKRRDCH